MRLLLHETPSCCSQESESSNELLSFLCRFVRCLSAIAPHHYSSLALAAPLYVYVYVYGLVFFIDLQSKFHQIPTPCANVKSRSCDRQLNYHTRPNNYRVFQKKFISQQIFCIAETTKNLFWNNFFCSGINLTGCHMRPDLLGQFRPKA